MAFSQKINSTIITILVLLVHCSNQKSDDDENRPYEFGFTINGEQHRYEKKDINGIIQGEFGFITADGVYHVTVYATDENGNFRILSTKNIKISGPLDGKTSTSTSTSTGYSPPPKRVGKTIDLSKESENVTPTPSKAFSLSTGSTIKPGCGGCGIVAPGAITPLPMVHFNRNKEPSRDQNQLTLNLKTSRESNDNFENVNGPIQNQPTNITSLLHNKKNNDDSNSRVINLSIPKIETISDDLNTVTTNHEEDISLRIRNRTFQDKEQKPNSNQQHVLLSDVGPQPVDYSESNSKHPLFNKNAFFEKKEGKSNNNNQIAQPPGLEIFDKISVTGNAENNINNVNSRTSTDATDSNISQAKVVDGNIIVPGNDPIPIQDKYPSMVDGLPDGITEGDVTNLLYKFNYTFSFHGHYEKGLKNGAKIGGYFVNGRDGFSRIVTYVADENGYRPKFQLVNLGLDSLDTPKEDIEKTFQLKGFEFIWYPIK